MKNRISLLAFVVCAGVAASFVAAQPKDKPAAPAKPAETTKMPEPKSNEWQSAATMGAEHVELARWLCGDWKATVTAKMSPTEAAATSEGTSHFEPMMGARFIKQSFESKFEGQAFKGEGLFGYNKASKQYEYTWIDNSTTGIMFSSGTKNEKGEIVFTGQCDNPMSGQRETMKSVLRFEGTTKMVFEMWSKASDGTEFKGLEVAYTRIDPKDMKKTITPPTEQHEGTKHDHTETQPDHK